MQSTSDFTGQYPLSDTGKIQIHSISAISRHARYICHLTACSLYLTSHEMLAISAISRHARYICDVTACSLYLKSHGTYAISAISRHARISAISRHARYICHLTARTLYLPFAIADGIIFSHRHRGLHNEYANLILYCSLFKQ